MLLLSDRITHTLRLHIAYCCNNLLADSCLPYHRVAVWHLQQLYCGRFGCPSCSELTPAFQNEFRVTFSLIHTEPLLRYPLRGGSLSLRFVCFVSCSSFTRSWPCRWSSAPGSAERTHTNMPGSSLSCWSVYFFFDWHLHKRIKVMIASDVHDKWVEYWKRLPPNNAWPRGHITLKDEWRF